MDPKSEEILGKILKKTPKELKEHEILFLRGRKGYIEKPYLDKFESVLKVKEPEPKKAAKKTEKKK